VTARVLMPDMVGFEVCRRIKHNPATHYIPVAMVTALDQPADRGRGLEAGADDFLTKPVSDVALIARVRAGAACSAARPQFVDWRRQTNQLDLSIRNSRKCRTNRP
jgi:DNA-binding response OmpR family regulator